jgi:hypothetical protein
MDRYLNWRLLVFLGSCQLWLCVLRFIIINNFQLCVFYFLSSTVHSLLSDLLPLQLLLFFIPHFMSTTHAHNFSPTILCSLLSIPLWLVLCWFSLFSERASGNWWVVLQFPSVSCWTTFNGLLDLMYSLTTLYISLLHIPVSTVTSFLSVACYQLPGYHWWPFPCLGVPKLPPCLCYSSFQLTPLC